MDAAERDPARLEPILTPIGHIEKRLPAISRATFLEDSDGIVLTSCRLAMIGEEARKLSDALKGRHPDIPWRAIYGLRNIVAHDHLRVNPDRVWPTATRELAPLSALCREELGRTGK